ncbi:MAG: hypothetical protein U1F87_05625 [Kiritimatiellia bacterium]
MMRSSANAGLTPSEVLLFLILLPPYLALAFYFLPTLIYPEKPNTNQVRVAWFLSGLTAGLGPLVLYWKRLIHGSPLGSAIKNRGKAFQYEPPELRELSLRALEANYLNFIAFWG